MWSQCFLGDHPKSCLERARAAMAAHSYAKREPIPYAPWPMKVPAPLVGEAVEMNTLASMIPLDTRCYEPSEP